MPNPSDIFDKPGHLIRRLQQIAVALFMEETAAHGLTPIQYSALLAVRLWPGMDHAGLGKITALDRSTVADVIRRLEAKGFLRRETTEEDKRVKLVFLTETGEKALDTAETAVEDTQKRILAPLDPDERKSFVAMMRKVVAANNDFSRAPLRETAGKHRAE